MRAGGKVGCAAVCFGDGGVAGGGDGVVVVEVDDGYVDGVVEVAGPVACYEDFVGVFVVDARLGVQLVNAIGDAPSWIAPQHTYAKLVAACLLC